MLDREAHYGGPESQHPGPVGDRADQPQVRQEAGPRPVRGGVGGTLEQHHSGRNQNVENR